MTNEELIEREAEWLRVELPKFKDSFRQDRFKDAALSLNRLLNECGVRMVVTPVIGGVFESIPTMADGTGGQVSVMGDGFAYVQPLSRGEGDKMNPYAPTITDEVSGVIVPNPLHAAYKAGQEDATKALGQWLEGLLRITHDGDEGFYVFISNARLKKLLAGEGVE